MREMASLSDCHGSVEETDVDELLRWTNGLNYDQLVELCQFSIVVDAVVYAAMYQSGRTWHPLPPQMVWNCYYYHQILLSSFLYRQNWC